MILTGPCGETGREDWHERISKHEGIVVDYLPFPACEGTYRITAKAYHDGTLIGRASHYARIKP